MRGMLLVKEAGGSLAMRRYLRETRSLLQHWMKAVECSSHQHNWVLAAMPGLAVIGSGGGRYRQSLRSSSTPQLGTFDTRLRTSSNT